MEPNELKAAIEAILFIATEPMSAAQIKKLLKVKKEEEEEVAPDEEASAEPSEETQETSEPQLESIQSAESIESIEHIEQPAEPVATDDDVLNQLESQQAALDSEISVQEIKSAINQLMEEYAGAGRGIEIVNVANGFQFRTKARFAKYIRNFYKIPRQRLSTPAMETLSVIAYQQPISRLKIEEIRGVDTGGVLKTLLDRDFIRIVGRSEELGRPILYGTTQLFLETFGLAHLADLPSLRDLDSLEPMNPGSSASPETASDEEETVEPGSEEDIAAFEDTESNEMLAELENSMRNLKDMEGEIFKPTEVSGETSSSQEGLGKNN